MLPATVPMAVAVGLAMTTSGCATTEQRLALAAAEKGRAEARATVPDLPAGCRRHMERVTPRQGDRARWIQAKWEANADAVDRQIDNCAAFHDDFKHRIEGEDRGE
jgi:hypothetical protein